MCKNMTYILWKVDVPPNMCRGIFVAINKLITKMYKHNIKTDDDINANLLRYMTTPVTLVTSVMPMTYSCTRRPCS